MRSRAVIAVAAIVAAGLLAALGWAIGWPGLAVAILAVIGLVGGAVGAQALLWLRTTAGRISRIDNRLEAMRATGDRRHEIMLRSFRENRKHVGEAAAAARRAEKATDSTKTIKELRQDLKEMSKRQAQDLRELRHNLTQKLDDQVVLLEDYQQLMRLVPMPLPMPRPGTWAASEDYLLWLVGFVLERRPQVVVDIGSGQSSVWMAGAMRAAGYSGKVIAIDHDEEFAQQTRALAERQGVSDWLEVRCAPLSEQTISGRDVTWYDVALLDGIDGIALLSIDGPPGKGNPEARWSALPVLRERLAPGGVVVLDDMIRVDEQSIAEDWHARWPELSRVDLDFEKGAAVFTAPA